MMDVDVTVQVLAPQWKTSLRPYGKTVRGLCAAALAETRLARLDCRFTLAVVLADDEFVRGLNHTYRSKDKATNVLSFPAHEAFEGRAARLVRGQKECELGDIVMAYETVRREALEQKKSFSHHAAHLLVHGCLHLLGYDHEDEAEAGEMERKEIKILKKLGVENPYL